MKKIINLTLNIFLSILSYIIPKDKKLILIGAGGGKSVKGNPKYIYLYFLKNKHKFKDINVTWITKNQEKLNKLRVKNLPVVNKISLNGFWKILRSKEIIIDQSTKDFSYLGTLIGNFNIIQTWHGTPLKEIGLEVNKENNILDKIFKKCLEKEFKDYSLICSTSEEVTKKLSQTFKNKNIKITGYPRNDILFDKTLVFNNLERSLNLSNYKKIISYIPTFRDIEINKKPFSLEELEKINKFLKRNNYLMIIKKHRFDKNFRRIKKYSNIKDYSNEIEDVQELLIYTDILITDYSSVFFDFCLTNKPIIFYPYDYNEYINKCRGMYYNYYEELPGPFAEYEEELLNLIKKVDKWFKNKSYQNKYKKFKDKFNKYQDGNSCKRIMDEILK